MKLEAIVDRPLEVGQEACVRVRLPGNDGTPVKRSDLIVVHTQPIHLLIVDRSLGDYHHEHPTPTETPGEYAFHFTPRRPGPYRIWADVVRGDTGVQEYVVADVPATAPAGRHHRRDRRPYANATGHGRRPDLRPDPRRRR